MNFSSLLLGFARLLDISGSLARYPRRSPLGANLQPGWRADADAIRSDWERVMDRMNR